MYVPRHFAIEDRDELLDVMRANPFALLVTTGGGLEATHVPVIVEEREGEPFGVIRAHVAKANPQAKAVAAGGEALVVFSGPHAYVSPSWYGPGPAVPTWDYVAVHAYGTPRVIDEPAAVVDLLRRQAATYESGFERPWTLEEGPFEHVERLLAGNVAFELPVARIDGKTKAGQNRRTDQPGVVRALEAVGDAGGMAMAAEIRRRVLTDRESFARH